MLMTFAFGAASTSTALSSVSGVAGDLSCASHAFGDVARGGDQHFVAASRSGSPLPRLTCSACSVSVVLPNATLAVDS